MSFRPRALTKSIKSNFHDISYFLNQPAPKSLFFLGISKFTITAKI